MERKGAAVRGEREIGHAGGYAAGPTLIGVAALHGNEPAGVRALQRVFDRILDGCVSIRGEFAGLLGNVTAFRTGDRMVDEDMNRVWGRGRIERGRRGEDLPATSEAVEQEELAAELDRLLRHATGRVYVLDLHTASSDTPPFVVLGDTLRNREFARGFPVPIVLGLEEHILGTLMEHISERGHVGVAVEGGRHDDPASVDRLESSVWMALVRAGCLDADDVPDLDLHRERLRRAGEELPAVLEIIHRHPAAPDFVMNRGYSNFQKVRAGEVLAQESAGAVTAPRRGLVFLPRYQTVGDDGFFMARRVNPVWLTLSARLRKTVLPALAARLPGVRSHPRMRNTLQVEGKLARRLMRRVFHLLGYRVLSPERGRMLLERRREHEAGPSDSSASDAPI